MRNEPNKKKDSNDKSSSIDLTNLIQISGNDLEFVRETIELVLLTMPKTIENIQLAHSEKDLVLLKRTMHCIRPTMITFNHEKLQELNREVEKWEMYSDLDAKVPEIELLLEEFLSQLKEEL